MNDENRLKIIWASSKNRWPEATYFPDALNEDIIRDFDMTDEEKLNLELGEVARYLNDQPEEIGLFSRDDREIATPDANLLKGIEEFAQERTQKGMNLNPDKKNFEETSSFYKELMSPVSEIKFSQTQSEKTIELMNQSEFGSRKTSNITLPSVTTQSIFGQPPVELDKLTSSLSNDELIKPFEGKNL